MGGRWKPFGFGSFFILVLGIQVSWSLNDEGLVLVAFRSRIVSDPLGALSNWKPNDADPCLWSGVHCVDSKVQVLNMTGLLLEGTLAPELGKLRHLKSLVLYNNCFTGEIPKELGGLTALELLDLRDNDFRGIIPSHIGRMLSLRHLLLCNNRFEGSIPLDLGTLNLLSEFEFDDYLDASGIGCVNRKFGHCVWKNDSDYLNKADSFLSPIKGALMRYLSTLPLPLFNFRKNSQRRRGHGCFHTQPRTLEPHMARDAEEELASFPRRKLLDQASNVAAAPAGDVPPTIQAIALPTTRSSGAFPAIPDANKKQPYSTEAPQPSAPPLSHDTSSPAGQTTQSSSSGTSNHTRNYIFIATGIAIFLIILAVVIFLCRTQAVTTIGPWKTGLSGQLQKAFISGVPKLNRTELETACEDFSNIIDTINGCTVYKGTLSSGVEIAVASTTVTSLREWPKSAELAYRKKIETLSRVNHKNFVNLIGFCEEDEPFSRMMVFEYAPNGSLFEHLHIKELEHLDWNVRVRIIMGTAYCLQYMHHDLNPPLSHSNLGSTSIFLTDDYAAKIAEIGFWAKFNSKKSTEEENSELPPSADPETNVYNFGIMLLEIISGKLPSEKEGSLVNWASEYLKDKGNIRYMIDPTLKSFKNNELLVICEVIEDCINSDPRQRPTMKEIISKLREVITISPDQAVPRLSPLWWAELEILSVEAT